MDRPDGYMQGSHRPVASLRGIIRGSDLAAVLRNTVDANLHAKSHMRYRGTREVAPRANRSFAIEHGRHSNIRATVSAS